MPTKGDLIEYGVWGRSEFQIDPDGTMDLDTVSRSVNWQSTADYPSSQSQVKGALWIKSLIINRSKEKIHLLLDHPYTLTDEIHVHLQHKGVTIQTMAAGDRIATVGAVAHSRNPLFNVELQPGENFLYIRVKSQALLSGKFDLWDPMPYFNKVNQELVFVSVLLGGLLILVCYNLFLYFSMKSKVYLHYVLYLVTFLNVQIIFSGVSRIFLVGSNDALIFYWNEGVHVSVKLAWTFALSFAIHFLNLPTYYPRLGRLIQGVMIFMASSILTGLFLPYGLDSFFMVFLTVGAAILLLGLGIWSSLRGYRPAIYYTIGWAILLVASGVVALKSAGVLPINLLTTWAQIVGAAIEGLVLSLALGERYNYLQNRSHAEREVFIKKLMEKEASKAHSYSQLEKIIYPHQIELIKNGSSLEQTMPTGQGEACVISFDTIGSSKLDRKKARAFLNDTFALCYRDMLAGYDQKKMEASAYRLKEVGDGFFCSIGFPFQTPGGQNPADLALKLALQFSKNFQKEAHRHGFTRPVQASIAISFGEVEAYYPSAGVLEYNMFGRGIILADRYEKLRKGALRQITFTGNLLVVDYRVFNMLSPASQVLFQRFDVDAVQQTIRDDEQAHCFYFMELRSESARSQPAA
ncbi:MAG TPA: 7TM diverse intracellular signaling domain-containing protein [Oligoflexus sp.]|uniref:7TMR-DISM family protein n=1 Tax=Oligoflexus sp. TaxID=1971216 RepID=UPI002D394C01|nr:7TM diverse intracellular signaling domain-containing protein [Oligoflexus sp.]HYX34881.1 7TM diverse intracellular signaling domain-containing protein [Oligoflexus sp.]